jgi:hypothetical protein
MSKAGNYMTRICRLALVVLTLVAPAGRAYADPVVVGKVGDGYNCFPFGCGQHQAAAASRYQQVYNSAAFAGPMLIDEIQFFRSFGSITNTGSYFFYLSTTGKAVDRLDTTNFDLNVGLDRVLFSVVEFTGSASAPILSIIGSNPFRYDPRLGNLLLDIVIPGGAVSNSGEEAVYFAAHNENADGVFSRAHNFGTGFEGYGLVTRFVDSAAPVPEPATLGLLGVGLIAVAARLRRGQTPKR